MATLRPGQIVNHYNLRIPLKVDLVAMCSRACPCLVVVSKLSVIKKGKVNISSWIKVNKLARRLAPIIVLFN